MTVRQRGGLRSVMALSALLVGAVAMAIVFAGLIFRRAQSRARAQHMPPIVILTEPGETDSIAEGSLLTVSATAFGRRPILRAELWVNGDLVTSQTSPEPNGTLPLTSIFQLSVSSEPMSAAVRAVDVDGMIGQSALLRIIPDRPSAPDDVALAVVATEGETLADIAARFDVDLTAVQRTNPELADRPLSPGALVGVPSIPEEEPSKPAAPGPASGSDAVHPSDIAALEVAGTAPLWSYLVVRPPAAPEGLRAQSQGCEVTLAWMDRASNEAAYEVWYAGVETPPQKLVELTPAGGGSAWVRLSAPEPGFLTFWIEAVNLIGRAPSNPDAVTIDSNCPSSRAAQLRIEALDMTLGATYDRAYCYVSFEGAPEVRLPQFDGDFFEVRSGRASIRASAADNRAWALPVPADGSLEMGGECWGWSDEILARLGDFQHSFAAEEWDGTKVILDGGEFQIQASLAVASAGGGAGILKTYGYDDPTAPRITDLRLERDTDPKCLQLCWRLVWKWQGAKSSTDTMLVDVEMAIDGSPAWMRQNLPGVVGQNSLDVPVDDKTMCGRTVAFTVSQWIEGSTIRTSGQHSRTLPRCPYRLTVRFDYLDLPWTGDGAFAGPCDTIDAYYWIGVNDQGKSFWGGCSFGTGCFLKPLACGRYSFVDLAAGSGDPSPDVFHLAIPQEANRVDLTIATLFTDYDWGSAGDDAFAPFVEHYTAPSLLAAEQDLGCQGKTFLTDLHVNDTADSRVQYTISIFPNPCTPAQYRP